MFLDKLQAINASVNREIHYTRDRKDHWQTPEETQTKKKGDCEDFAILKMAKVLELDLVPDNDVRLLYCKHCDPRRRIEVAHMVLEVWLNGVPYLLDNLLPSVYPRSERSDIKPLLSFNAQQLWFQDTPTGKDPQQRMKQWKRTLARAATQNTYLGFSV